MSDEIRLRARQRDGLTEILVLLPHPMETGQRLDSSGRPIAAHFITELHVQIEGRAVVHARLTQAVSQDPLMTFRVRGARIGERVAVSCVDTRGHRRSAQTPIT